MRQVRIATYLPGPDQAARFQHLDVLKDSGQ